MIYKFEIERIRYFFDGESLSLYKDCLPQVFEKKQIKEEYSTVLHNAIINVTNRCNGNCVYCYEKRKRYEEKNLNKEGADKILKTLFENYEDIEEVTFFGGEPVLNYEIIEYMVDKFEEKSFVKNYKIITNAVNIDNYKLEFFIKNNFKMVISIDGPAEIHDKLRLNCSHKKVEEVIEKIKKSSIGDKMELNCTYTKLHRKMITVEKLVSYYEKKGIKYHISNVITDIEWLRLPEGITKEKEDIDNTYENLASNSLNIEVPRAVRDVIIALVERKYKLKFCYDLCQGYKAIFDCDGNYCQCEELIYENQINYARLQQENMKNTSICDKCWAKGICSHCVVDLVLKRTNLFIERNRCIKQELYGYALIKLVTFYHYNPKKFQSIIDNWSYVKI